MRLLSLLMLEKRGRDFLQHFDPEFLNSFLEKEVPIIWERAEKKVTGETDREYQENVKKVKESIVTGLASFAGGKSFVEKHPYLRAYLPKKEEEKVESKGHAGKRKREHPSEQHVPASILASSMSSVISPSAPAILMETENGIEHGQNSEEPKIEEPKKKAKDIGSTAPKPPG